MRQADLEATGQPESSPAPARPRVVIRADLRPALKVLMLVAACGLPLGLLWFGLAPPETVTMVVDPTTGRVGALPLPGQSEHRFDDMAIFVLIGLTVGLLTGAGLWLLRRWRGPVVLMAAALGAMAAAWLAMRVGLWLGPWRYSGLAGAPPGAVVERAPVLESGWLVVVQPFGVLLAYSLAVAWNGADDLGRSPS